MNGGCDPTNFDSTRHTRVIGHNRDSASLKSVRLVQFKISFLRIAKVYFNQFINR